MGTVVRSAAPADAASIHAFVMESAIGERFAHETTPRFHRGLGAEMLDAWTGCRLTGDARARLAGEGA